ncbi:hypothetical protein ACLOJK_027973, partial [Asimina triloba]
MGPDLLTFLDREVDREGEEVSGVDQGRVIVTAATFDNVVFRGHEDDEVARVTLDVEKLERWQPSVQAEKLEWKRPS